jgi:putative phosphoesterase
MRIAVISDIHGNFAALEAVLADIGRRGVDATIGLGDFLSGPFDPKAVVDAIAASGIPCVRGNHDRYLVDPPQNDWAVDVWVRDTITAPQADWLRALPATQIFDGAVFMCHATPQDDTSFWMDRPTDDLGVISMPRENVEARAVGVDYPVLVCGHTHVQRTLRLEDGRLLVNPGAVGLPFLQGSTDARYGIIERRGSEWSVEFFAIPYDRATPMDQARRLGFPGFAKALQTGWATLGDL